MLLCPRLIPRRLLACPGHVRWVRMLGVRCVGVIHAGRHGQCRGAPHLHDHVAVLSARRCTVVTVPTHRLRELEISESLGEGASLCDSWWERNSASTARRCRRYRLPRPASLPELSYHHLRIWHDYGKRCRKDLPVPCNAPQ